MTKKYVHKWEEIDRIHVQPSITKAECYGDSETVRRTMEAMEHRTAVHLRCVECGEVECRILIGWKES